MVVPEVSRTTPSTTAGEREMLESWLDFHRDTLVWKCAGLSDERPYVLYVGSSPHIAPAEERWVGTPGRDPRTRAPQHPPAIPQRLVNRGRRGLRTEERFDVADERQM